MSNNLGGQVHTTENFTNGIYSYSRFWATDSHGNVVATTSNSQTTLSNFAYEIGNNGWVNTGRVAATTMTMNIGATQVPITLPYAGTVPQSNVWFVIPGSTHGGIGYIDSTGQNGYVWPIGGSAYSADYAHVSVNGSTVQTCIYVNNQLQACGAQNSLLHRSDSKSISPDVASTPTIAVGGVLSGIGQILQAFAPTAFWGKIISGTGSIIAACGAVDCLDMLPDLVPQNYCGFDAVSGTGFGCSDDIDDFADDDPAGGFDGGGVADDGGSIEVFDEL